MKFNNTVRETITSSLMIALGILIPVIFHAFGLGSTFLPMHIPVLIAGFVLSAPFAAAVGACTPLLSSLITGMPPVFPVMPYMVFELAAYGGVSSLLSRKARLNPYIALIGSMAAGRIVAGAAVWVLAEFFGAKLPGPFAFIASAVATGLPGIIIQIVLIPPLVLVLKKMDLVGEGVARN